jgi:hypothetical protein
VPLLEDRFGAWKPISRAVGIGRLCCYALFLLYAALDRSGFLSLDYVNLMIHEGGHLFFSWFGETIMILGGTLGELLVPLLCAAYFFFRRETPGFAYCTLWFFENFPYTDRYMSGRVASAIAIGAPPFRPLARDLNSGNYRVEGGPSRPSGRSLGAAPRSLFRSALLVSSRQIKLWLSCDRSTCSFTRNLRTMSGLGPSPTVYVRRTTTSRPRIGLYRTAVTISSRIDHIP